MNRDRDNVPFEDDFTENRGPDADEQEDAADEETLDPDVDSEADDTSMKDNTFGVNPGKP